MPRAKKRSVLCPSSVSPSIQRTPWGLLIVERIEPYVLNLAFRCLHDLQPPSLTITPSISRLFLYPHSITHITQNYIIMMSPFIRQLVCTGSISMLFHLILTAALQVRYQYLLIHMTNQGLSEAK